MLRGAVAPHFLWKMHPRYDHLARYKKDARILRNWGANLVVLDWNSGFLGDADYVETLVEAAEYAYSIGLRPVLNLHSRGMEDSSSPWANRRLTEVDLRLAEDWRTLLRDPNVSERLRRVVSMYVVLSEPEGISFAGAVPAFEAVCDAIRHGVRDQQVVCAYSLPNLDFEGIESIGAERLNGIPVEVHLYHRGVGWTEQVKQYLRRLRKQGVAIYVGEIGWVDPPEVVREEVSFFRDNGISFAAWGMVDGPHNEADRLLKRDNTPTANGEVVRTALGQPW